MSVVLSLLAASGMAASAAGLAWACLRGPSPADDRDPRGPRLATLVAGAGVTACSVSAGAASWDGAALAAVTAAAVTVVPALRRRHRARRRGEAVDREVPTLLDSVALRVEGGLPLLPALTGSADLFGGDSPLRAELLLLEADLALGRGAADAVRALRQRLGTPLAGSSLGAVERALRTGAPVRAILLEQAERARQGALIEAERFANTLTVRLLLPLLAFVFPASFLVILSPVVVAFLGE